MLSAFSLALGQLGDRQVIAVIVKSALVALALFAALGALAWWGLDRALARWSGGSEDIHGLIALLLVIGGGWLLWRVIALAVMQFFADDVVRAVEARHYPEALASARQVPMAEELAEGLKGAGRALLFNLLALPVAAVLLVTGVGAPLVFLFVNAVLLGRELTGMVWLRHRHDADAPLPLSGFERLGLGGAVAGLLTVPFVNLVAPVLGAAAATHLVHRKLKGRHHAP